MSHKEAKVKRASEALQGQLKALGNGFGWTEEGLLTFVRNSHIVERQFRDVLGYEDAIPYVEDDEEKPRWAGGKT